MSRHTSRLVQSLAAAVGVVSLSACGASLDAQTYQERNQAGSTDTAVGGLAIRNVFIAPPTGEEEVYEEGADAEVALTVTNATEDEDRLISATTDAADEVVVLVDGEEDELVVPALGSTGDQVTLELLGLSRELRAGEYVEVTLRFEDAGEEQLLVPVALTGVRERPIYTGEYEEGGEEPALQGPAGGHELGGDAEEEPFAGGEGVDQSDD